MPLQNHSQFSLNGNKQLGSAWFGRLTTGLEQNNSELIMTDQNNVHFWVNYLFLIEVAWDRMRRPYQNAIFAHSYLATSNFFTFLL